MIHLFPSGARLTLLLPLALLLLACGTSSAPAPASTSAPLPSVEQVATPAPTPEARESPAAESRDEATPAPEATPTTAPASTPAAVPTQVARLLLPPPPPPSTVPRAPGVTTVILDPGHGGEEVGAANYGVVEKESNLDMAFRVERLLAARGLRPVLTRRTDARAVGVSAGATPTGFSAQRVDLQGRIDMANAEGAAVFVSIHSNGSNSGAERGLEVYYNSQRPHAPENRRLATAVYDGVTSELLATGFSITPRGVKDDSCLRLFQGRCFPLFLLGPERITTRDEILRRGGNPDALLGPGQNEVVSRAAQMPAALVELLFVSNPDDAAILRTEGAREAMARGVARGVARFLGVE